MGILYEACAPRNEEVNSGACGIPIFGYLGTIQYAMETHTSRWRSSIADLKQELYIATAPSDAQPAFSEFTVDVGQNTETIINAGTEDIVVYNTNEEGRYSGVWGPYDTVLNNSIGIKVLHPGDSRVQTRTYSGAAECILPTDARAGTFRDFTNKHKYWALLGYDFYEGFRGAYCNGNGIAVRRNRQGGAWTTGFLQQLTNPYRLKINRTMSVLCTQDTKFIGAAVLEAGSIIPASCTILMVGD